MSFVHIKRQRVPDADGGMKEVFAVQAIALHSPQGKKLIPNPGGSEARIFETFEAAESAVRQAGFDYIFEGKKVHLSRTSTSAPAALPQGGSGASLLATAVPGLIQRLSDRESAAVANAAYALGELQDPTAVEPLVGILGHEDAAIRKAVAEALAKLGGHAVGPLQTAFERARIATEKTAIHTRLTVMTAYLEMSHTYRELLDQVLPQAISALEDENWLVRAQAALVVGQAAQFFRDSQLKG